MAIFKKNIFFLNASYLKKNEDLRAFFMSFNREKLHVWEYVIEFPIEIVVFP